MRLVWRPSRGFPASWRREFGAVHNAQPEEDYGGLGGRVRSRLYFSLLTTCRCWKALSGPRGFGERGGELGHRGRLLYMTGVDSSSSTVTSSQTRQPNGRESLSSTRQPSPKITPNCTQLTPNPLSSKHPNYRPIHRTPGADLLKLLSR